MTKGRSPDHTKGRASFGAAATPSPLGQAAMDASVRKPLDRAIAGGTSGIMKWMREYTQRAPQCADVRADIVLAKLEAAGYKEEAWESQDVGDRESYGRRIIGHVMHSLAGGSKPPRNGPFNLWYKKYTRTDGEWSAPCRP
jgi:hypothetical protein